MELSRAHSNIGHRWEAPSPLEISLRPLSIFVTDLVADGRPEIVAANSGQDATVTDTVAMLVNQTTGPDVTATVDTIPTGLSVDVDTNFHLVALFPNTSLAPRHHAHTIRLSDASPSSM
jgi:hypothetical protein